MKTRWRWKLGALLFITGILVSSTSCITQLRLDLDYLISGDAIPPECETDTRLLCTCNRIQIFWDQHGRVPSSPDELPYLRDYDCSLEDGWGREFLWESDGVSTVHVWSLGKDGGLGGTGRDADIGMAFVAGKTEAWLPPAPKEETENEATYP
ncbi:MAG: type II secretion system protein GspG [Planctomycetia bacterium]